MKQIDKARIDAITGSLKGILADTFILYYKTHAYHWNVEGPYFKSLHDMFMEQYTDMWNALDEVAERVRVFDSYAPVSVQQLMEYASLNEAGNAQDAMEMVGELAQDHEGLSQRLAEGIKIACDAGDDATADLLTVRLGVHEKTAWMLRATSK